jgi:CheY-like chemotaxis protein
MLDDRSTPESFHNVLEMIRRNVFLEARLIDDLLDRTRIQSGKLRLKREVIDAHALVLMVIEVCREDLRSANLELALDLAARRHNVDADLDRLQQVLWSLLNNAIKFTPAGGMVTVRSRDLDASPEGRSGAWLNLEVSDTGIGIEPDVLPRIFEILEHDGLSSSRRPGGLGLGLLISRSIVEQHGGRLAASSAGKNRGATFTIEIPSVDAMPIQNPAGEARNLNGINSQPTPTILLVEDNADIRGHLSRLLANRGHNVHAASTLEEALRIAASVDFSLLISDIELPDGSGLELMWKLRSDRAVAGIALSGFGSADDVELSRSAGFSEHLTKPVDFRRLEQAIERSVARGPVEGLVAT